MEKNSTKQQSQVRTEQRKFQYLTSDNITINNLTSSSIDQHRNSIEQRIANLEIKLAKKFNPELQLSMIGQSLPDNYVSTRRTYQFSGLNTQNKNSTPLNPQINPQSSYNHQISLSGFSHPKQTTGKGNTFNYLADFDNNTNEDLVLKEKKKTNVENNKYKYDSNPDKAFSKDKLKAVLDKSSDRNIFQKIQDHKNIELKSRLIGKKIKNGAQTKNQNPVKQQQRKYQSSQKFDRKYPLNHYQPQQIPAKQNKTSSIAPRSNPILNGRYFEQFNPLIDTNISQTKISVTSGTYPFEKHYNQAGVNLKQPEKTIELYKMMRSIMVGQERLEKELMMLKNSKIHEHNQILLKKSNNTVSLKPNKQNENNKDKYFSIQQNEHFSVPESRIMSPIPVQKSKKPRADKSLSPKTVTNRKSVSPNAYKPNDLAQHKASHSIKESAAANRKRANSAVIGKKLPGKIQKNKERFDELYKQAQLNKRLSESSSRFTVSNETISSVWDKIKSSIKRAQSQDAETSVIYHENNRWVNDHLVSKIELQKKLKSDLVKKIYDMVENKCLYK